MRIREGILLAPPQALMVIAISDKERSAANVLHSAWPVPQLLTGPRSGR